MSPNPAPRWPVVLADLDGTLADSVPVIVASYRHVLTELAGREVDDATIKSWIGRTLLDVFSVETPGRAVEFEAAYRAWNEEHMPELLRGFDGVPELVTDLQRSGAEFGIVTSKRRATARWTMDLAGLGADVPLLCGMEDSDRHKPDPTPLLVALDKIGRLADEAVYLGDATVDVLAARAAGMPVVAVTWGAGTRDDLLAAGPDAIVDTVDELRALLLG